MSLSDRDVECIEKVGRLYVPDEYDHADEIIKYHQGIRDFLNAIDEHEEDLEDLDPNEDDGPFHCQ